VVTARPAQEAAEVQQFSFKRRKENKSMLFPEFSTFRKQKSQLLLLLPSQGRKGKKK